MDRKAWWAIVHGSQRVPHDSAAKQQQLQVRFQDDLDELEQWVEIKEEK